MRRERCGLFLAGGALRLGRGGFLLAQLPLVLGGLFGGAAALFLFLLLSFGLERHGRGGFGFALQALALFGLARLAFALDGFEPHPLFVVRKLRGGFGFSQHPLALGGLFRGAALLLFLQAFEFRLPGPVGGRTRFVHQPLAFGGIGRFTAAAFFVELLSLGLARPFGRDARFFYQPFALGCFLRFATQALFFIALPLGFVRALRRGFRFAQQLFALRGAFGLEAVLLLLETNALFLERPFGSRLRFARGTFGSGGFFSLPAPARFLGAARFGLFGATLRFLGLLLVAGAFLLGFLAKSRLFRFSGLAQTILLGFRASRTRACSASIGAASRLFRFRRWRRLFLCRLPRRCLFLFCAVASPCLFFGFSGFGGLLQPRLFVFVGLFGGQAFRALLRQSRRPPPQPRSSRSRYCLLVLLRLDDLGDAEVGRMVFGNLLGADLRGPGEVCAQLLGKDRRIAARDLRRLLLAPEPSEQAAAGVASSAGADPASIGTVCVCTCSTCSRVRRCPINSSSSRGDIRAVSSTTSGTRVEMAAIAPSRESTTSISACTSALTSCRSNAAWRGSGSSASISGTSYLRSHHEQEQQRTRGCEDHHRRILEALMTGRIEHRIAEVCDAVGDRRRAAG